jgi:hypothetical protein
MDREIALAKLRALAAGAALARKRYARAMGSKRAKRKARPK